MWEKHLNALLVVIISVILWGALAIQFFYHEEPCALCLLQRLGMLGVTSGALMNVKFGPSKAHYGLSLLSAIFGGFVALRQIALHVCPDFSKFGEPFWGLSLYTWSFITFASSVAYIALLMLFFDKNKNPSESKIYNLWGHISFFLIFFVSLTNIFITFWLCGFGAC